VLDSAAASVGAINIGVAANASPGRVAWYGMEMESETGVALGVTQLALFGAGAVYGFVQTSRCSAYIEERRRQPEGPGWSPALDGEGQSPAPVRNEPAGRAQSPAPAAPANPPPTPAAASTPPATTPPTTPEPTPAKAAPNVPTAAFPD
jgi:hypothetical protein